nr:acyl-CoA dehydrogenase family protein [Reinekea sp. G2M2-21]
MNSLDQFKKFLVERVAPLINDHDAPVSSEVFDLFTKSGVLGANIDRRYGGKGLDIGEYAELTEEVEKVSHSLRSLMTVHGCLVSESIARFGNKVQQEKYLKKLSNGSLIASFAMSEPNVGSDAQAVETSYRKVDGGFVIDGVKTWITFGNKADIFLVIANNDELGISAFLVNRSAGVVTNAIPDLSVANSTHIADVLFDNVFVEEGCLLGSLGSGFSYVANYALTYGRYSVALGALGMSQLALDCMIKESVDRSQGGKKIIEHDLIKQMITDCATKIQAARSLLRDAERSLRDNKDDADKLVCMAKLFTSQVVSSVTKEAVQLFGARGLLRKNNVERLYRESRIFEIIEGSTQVQQLLISSFVLQDYRKQNREVANVS